VQLQLLHRPTPETWTVHALRAGCSHDLGRHHDCDHVLTDSSVASHHLRLQCGLRGAWVRDLGSGSGFEVNDEHFSAGPVWVEPDDVLRLGGTRLRVTAAVPLNRTWLGTDSAVLRLARRVDQEGDFSALPVLADALEEAGCQDAELLDHCRANAPHRDGCWVIDTLLGRTLVQPEDECLPGQPIRALLSDIHGNLEALSAVLGDVEQLGVHRLYCLGDMVGYGPNPVECLEQVRGCTLAILGNHDQGAMFDPSSWSPTAEKAIYWTRERLERVPWAWEFLGALPRSHNDNGLLFVHGSPRNPLNEYVFPEDVYNQRKMTKLFDLVPRASFQGHTHVAGIFVEQTPGEQWEFFSPEEVEYRWTLDARKVMINVGSVGQPRDADWRSSYVLLDRDTISFHRLEYDVEATIQKIYNIPELENFLGDRLREGR
jgi:predicted phosphodiesterase